MRCEPDSGGGRRGFTLVEMLVVVVIIGIMSVAIVAEMRGTFQDALLRSTSRELAGAFNVASSRAISVNRPHRISLDSVKRRYFLERGARGGSEFHRVADVPGGSGTLDSRISIRFLDAEGDSSGRGRRGTVRELREPGCCSVRHAGRERHFLSGRHGGRAPDRVG
jgi:type II secretion system protein H